MSKDNKYIMDLGITHEEIMILLSGESLEFIFQNVEGLPDIKVNVKEIEQNTTLSEAMDLRINNESEGLWLTGMS